MKRRRLLACVLVLGVPLGLLSVSSCRRGAGAARNRKSYEGYLKEYEALRAGHFEALGSALPPYQKGTLSVEEGRRRARLGVRLHKEHVEARKLLRLKYGLTPAKAAGEDDLWLDRRQTPYD